MEYSWTTPAIDDLPLPTLQIGTVGPGVVVLNEILA